ncbi:MAG: DNA primase, partial [Methanoregula sp.]
VEDMTKKEVIKTLRNKVPIEYVRDQYFEDAAELPADIVKQNRSVPGSDEGNRNDAAGRAGQKRPKESSPKVPVTIRDHMEDVRGKSVARFMNGDMGVIREIRSEEMEKAVETLDEPATGVIVDRTVDQKLLDRLVWKGLEYVAAKDFKGIIKRPLNIRLIKISS